MPRHLRRQGSTRPAAVIAAAVALALLGTGARASAQAIEREARTFVVPPPSENSTGGVAVEPVAPLHSAPRLRGFKLETRDALHPDEIVLIGLDQSEKPYRADIGLERSRLGTTVTQPEDERDPELYERLLAVYSGEHVNVPVDDAQLAPAPNVTTKKNVVRVVTAETRLLIWGPAAFGVVLLGLLLLRRRRSLRR